MRITFTTFITLDGVIQGPGSPDEDRSDGFDLGGWVVPYMSDDMGEAIGAWFSEADAFLFGRRTYEEFAASWGKVTDPDDPVASRFNELPKYVASRTLTEVAWSGSELLSGDLAEAVAELKRKPGRELQVHGSGSVAQELMRHDLIDEYRFMTVPVVLGKGRRLYDGAKPAALKPVESRKTGTGMGIDVYEAAGEPDFGSYSLEEERTAF